MHPYTCKRTPEPLTIDGNLNKPAWQRAQKSHRFIDCIGGNPALYDTRAAVLWDDTAMYVGFWAEEPFPTATITQRDGLLWLENDYEVFIDGGDIYYELQISARNLVYEVLYIWQDAYKANPLYRAQPAFDVVAHDARVFGGNHDRTGEHFWKGSHPRGNRWAFLDWDLPGLQTAVQFDGVLNDPQHPGKSLTVEIAFPWDGLEWLATGRSLPPKDGDIWKLFVGRYEALPLNGEVVSVGWGWDVIGTNDNHYPEKFTPFTFSTAVV